MPYWASCSPAKSYSTTAALNSSRLVLCGKVGILLGKAGSTRERYGVASSVSLRFGVRSRGPDEVRVSNPKNPLKEVYVQNDEKNDETSSVHETNNGHAWSEEKEVYSQDETTVAIVPKWDGWKNLPPRYKLIITTSLAFVICNMDKVNMSIAIIPMSHHLGWTASTAGLVQSSFFWGYALSQLPGGFLAQKFSGRFVLQAGVLLWSLATALVPLCASFLPGLLFCRFLVGLGEGVSPPAATDLIARTIPAYERARAVVVVFGGLNVGSVVGLLLAPVIIKIFGWEVVFYLFGLLGVIWCLGFDAMAPSPVSEGSLHSASAETSIGQRKIQTEAKTSPDSSSTKAFQPKEEASQIASDLHSSSFNISNKAIPWKAFFNHPPVWAMMYAHFCGNWGHYSLLSWLPTYLSDKLQLDLTSAAVLSIFSPLGSVLVNSIAAPLADHLILRGVDTTLVRKLCQSIAFLSPATCMAIVWLWADLSPWTAVTLLTAGSSLSSFALAGLYCTHQDISPRYASALLGITNTVGAIPGILGVALTGFVLEQTKSWNLALFAPSIFFYITGVLVWNLFSNSETKDF